MKKNYLFISKVEMLTDVSKFTRKKLELDTWSYCSSFCYFLTYYKHKKAMIDKLEIINYSLIMKLSC